MRLFVLCCVCVLVSPNLTDSASLSAAEQKKYKQLIEGQGLYTTVDDVSIFTAHNFKTKLYGQDRGVLLEFYNSWCGFCQRFAPSWKALATDIRTWNVEIGAIDCSDEDNSPICREFEILGYPTLRYFHENFQEAPKKIGTDVKKGENVDALRANLIEQMLLEQQEGRGKNWPLLLPYEQPNVINIFDGVSDKVKYAFIIAENQTNLAVEVAMDLRKVPEIIVRSVKIIEITDAFKTNYHITSIPKLLAVNFSEKVVHHFNTEMSTREALILQIKEFLTTKGIEISNVNTTNDIFKGKWIENQVPDIAALLEERERQALRLRVKQMGDVVFQMDLETALRYSLKHEVAKIKTISGEKLTALKKYIEVIVKYFPTGRKGKNFLQDLQTEINSYGATVNGADIAKFLQPMDNEDEGIFSSPQQWLGCSGSSTRYRGYPCGLWKMFHYLTVNSDSKNPREVLEAMLGYVKHFFGCQDCSKHFQELAVKNDLHGVTELNSSVIWLWIAHNEVNKRLAGDASEDPEYPKLQFPDANLCSKCREGDKFNFTEVLNYLRHMYSSINVRYIGSDTKVLHDGLGTARSKRSTSWVVINRMDVSMCFILYLVCFGLLVLIVRQFLRKGYKKKMYVHDLLGKV